MIRPLFDKHQSKLLDFVNTDNGRAFLLDKWGGKSEGKIVKVTPDGYHEYLENNLFRATFFPRSPYIGKFAEMLTYLDISAGNRRPDEISMGDMYRRACFLESTYNSNTGGDGSVGYSPGASWAAAHDAATGNLLNDSATAANCANTGKNGDGTFLIYRGFFPFNTAALTSAATISAAVFSFYADAKPDSDNDGDDWVNVYQSTQADNTDLVVADFDAIGSTAGSTAKDITTDISTPAYNDWTLDATGLSWVSKTGYTKLGLREGHDVLNSAFAGANDSSNGINGNFADAASNKPKLVVTYTLPQSAFLAFM